VYLVGAGPGDPRLLTLRGATCLREADLVLYDGLVNPLLLRLTRGICERTARARRDGASIVPQEEINERLIAEARSGKTVVRLKGGDPYIFGRGSEEAAALQNAGVPFEVVPGVTAATGAGEYAGFSFTHRDISSAVAFVTGHEDPTRTVSRLDYQSLAKFPGTIVFYMGLGRLSEICQQLQTAGMSGSTPVAVVCQASLSSQQVVEGTLQTISEMVSNRHLKPPSLIVVGHCVTQRAQLSWFEKLPLFGLSVGITRPTDQADDIIEDVLRLGGEPVVMPMIEIQSLDTVDSLHVQTTLRRLAEFQWIVFTSVNGVSEFFRLLKLSGLDARSLHKNSIAAIGSSTARRLEDFGIRADLVPEESRAETLASSLIEQGAQKAVLWVRASRGRDVLPQKLSDAGIRLEQLVVYVNRDVDAFDKSLIDRLKVGALHWIGLSSPSIARRMAELLSLAQISQTDAKLRIVTISPVTTAAAKSCGLEVTAEATTATWAGMLEAIQASLSSAKSEGEMGPS
jgi:uroporphyrinogen III methyltransferase/synthase